MNDILRILLLVQIIIITIFLILRYFKIYKLPDCSTISLIQYNWLEFILFQREYTIKKFHGIKDTKLHDHLLKKIDGIGSAIDQVHKGSFHDIRIHLRTHLRYLEEYIDNLIDKKPETDLRVKLDNNAKKLANVLSKLNRQYDVDRLDKFLIDNNILSLKQIDVISKQDNSLTINEYEAVVDNVKNLINYLVDPPKRWPVNFIDIN